MFCPASHARTTAWASGLLCSVFWPSMKAPSQTPRKKILRFCLMLGNSLSAFVR